MREISSELIMETVARLSVEANLKLPEDIARALKERARSESWQPGKNVLNSLCLNAETAAETNLPICQDTGMACVFVELGQDVHIKGGGLYDAINSGVEKGYGEAYLRKSVVADPLLRVNTGNNCPALITVDIVPGNKIHISLMPKGFGSENMSRIAMLKPSDGRDGIVDFVLDSVKQAGPNPCPPLVVGLGIGGSFDKAALLAKKALLRPINVRNGQEYYSRMEEELLEKINSLGIGPAGYGGKTTALALNIEVFPTHIAGLPAAVNISCHATRRAEAWI